MYTFFDLDLINKLFEYPIIFIILNAFFIFATFTDIKWMRIFDVFNIIMLVTRIGVLVAMFIINGFEIWYLVKCLIGGLLMFIVLLAGAVITNAKIGGDIKFAGNIGLWLGFMPSVLVLTLSLVINMIFRKITKNVNAIALAPFLYIGFIITSILTYFLR